MPLFQQKGGTFVVIISFMRSGIIAFLSFCYSRMAVFMIVRANKNLKIFKINNSETKFKQNTNN